jgi:hypothetical protein
MVVAGLRSVFSQPSKEAIVEQWDQVVAYPSVSAEQLLAGKFHAAARLMSVGEAFYEGVAREVVLAFRHFPR